MYFTQEDFQRIKTWLAQNGIKDSGFPSTGNLKGGDIVTIVQDGVNKKITLDDFTTFSSIGSYFNVTKYLYDQTGEESSSKINIEEAIAACPEKLHKGGQVITFLNKEDTWEVWRYEGIASESWTDITNKWKCVQGSKNLGISLTLDNSDIEYLQVKNIAINCKTNDGKKASIIKLYVDDGLYQSWVNVSEINTVVSVGANTTIKVEVVEYGITYTESKKIDVVLPCYIGTSAETFNINDIKDSVTYIKSKALNGTFKVHTASPKSYIYLLVPEGTIIQNFTLSGISIPHTVSSFMYLGRPFTLYSSDFFDAGDYEIVIGQFPENNV